MVGELVDVGCRDTARDTLAGHSEQGDHVCMRWAVV
jgi:hypothetical protein